MKGREMERASVTTVIGVGGGGMHAVHHMVASQLRGVTFIVADTDEQALDRSLCGNIIRLGGVRFQGLNQGPGPNPHVGKDAAQKSIDEIKTALGAADLIFVVGGMGGRTGSGAAPVTAQAAKELGALTIGVVSSPFLFEGKRRLTIAEEGITALSRITDFLILIPNNQSGLASEDLNLEDMMSEVDEAMHSTVRLISGLIARRGFISPELVDVRDALRRTGMAVMGYASTSERIQKKFSLRSG
jgi:cell division protein FtsZ